MKSAAGCAPSAPREAPVGELQAIASLELFVAFLQVEHPLFPGEQLTFIAFSIRLEVVVGIPRFVIDALETGSPLAVQLSDGGGRLVQLADDGAERLPLLEQLEGCGREVSLVQPRAGGQRGAGPLPLGSESLHLGPLEAPDAIAASDRMESRALKPPHAGHRDAQDPRDVPACEACRGSARPTASLFPAHLSHLPPDPAGGNPAGQRCNGSLVHQASRHEKGTNT